MQVGNNECTLTLRAQADIAELAVRKTFICNQSTYGLEKNKRTYCSARKMEPQDPTTIAISQGEMYLDPGDRYILHAQVSNY